MKIRFGPNLTDPSPPRWLAREAVVARLISLGAEPEQADRDATLAMRGETVVVLGYGVAHIEIKYRETRRGKIVKLTDRVVGFLWMGIA